MNQKLEHVNWDKIEGEISGFGQGYEQACREMLDLCIDWYNLNANGDSPKYKGLKNVYGLLLPEGKAAEDLDNYLIEHGPSGFSGGMHHAVLSHFFFILKNGPDKYRDEMNKKVEKKAS